MARAGPPKATSGNEHASPHATTPEQQANVRLIFQSELGISHAQLIKVESTVLYNALSTKRHADVDAEDDGSFHSEVLKNAIDLLQRFHRCAPLYLKMDKDYVKRNVNFFAKDIFCRTFCSDIKGFDNKDNPRAWIDVFHFFQAMKKIWDGSLLGGLKVSGRDVAGVSFDARDEVAKSATRTRKGAVLWELMGLASKDIERYGCRRPETWCLEATIRLGMWRKRLRDNRDWLFSLPVDNGWSDLSDDILPECNDDAMRLFQELEEKFRAFYKKCEEQMPQQATVFPDKPTKHPSRAATPEADQDDDTCDQQGLEEMAQGDGTSEEVTTEMTAPQTIGPETLSKETIQEGCIPKGFIPHRVAIQNNARNSIPQKRAYIQKTLILSVYEQPTPRNTIITKDPRNSVPLRDPLALKRAMELIANVVRANGMQPDWDPEGTPPSGGGVDGGGVDGCSNTSMTAG